MTVDSEELVLDLPHMISATEMFVAAIKLLTWKVTIGSSGK
jgi:hypothetical protein